MNPEILLSASADASLIIWRPEETSGIWIPETRLGEVSSLKGATTAQGSSGGFWGGVWSCDGGEVSSWGKTGGWRVWREQVDGHWAQKSAISGAIRAVKGISWDSQGRYFLSVRYYYEKNVLITVWIKRRGCLVSGDEIMLNLGMKWHDLRFMDTI